MATTIKLKNGSGAPSASDLVQGEPALDLTNNRLYSENGSGSVVEIGTNPTSLSINGTAITATAAELNILDGVTSTAAELNILDGKAFLDEDDMSSNSATGIASQQSIKAYVDAQITAEDLDFQADSGGALSIDLDSETLTFTGGTGIDTSGSGNAVTFAIDSTVATLSGSQTLTNKSLTAPTITGTAVMASLDISGDVDVDGTLETDALSINGTTVTSTAAELNILDGVTSTAAELNILDGVTSTAAELNILDGVTSTTAELNILDGVTATTAELNVLDGVTAFLDEDDFASNSATAIPSQQSVKAYVTANAVTGSGLSNVVEDTTPQLGGSLDVNGQDIVSVSNGNITLTPNGSGLVRLDGNVDIQSGEIVLKNAGSVSNIKFYCESSNAHYTQLQSSAHSAYSGNVTLTLPAATDTLVGRATTDTLTNKTLTSPVLSGSVGIGTSSPRTGYLVDIQESADNGLNIQAGNAAADIALAVGSASTADKFVIQAGGNVGIGTASPTAVSGGVVIEAESATGSEFIASNSTEGTSGGELIGGYLFKNSDTSATEPHYAGLVGKAADSFGFIDLEFYAGRDTYETGGTPHLFIDGSNTSLGNVGIGTTSPDAPLHVKVTESSTGSTDPLIRFERFTSGDNAYLDITVDNANNLIGFQSTGSSDGGFTFGGASTERMRITSNGNVLIGRTDETLGGGNGDDLQIGSGSGGAGLTIHSSTTGIGDIQFSDGVTAPNSYKGLLRYDHNADAMTFWSNNSEKMRIDSSGNVGIGETSPSSYYATELVVSSSSEGGITMAAEGTTQTNYLMFADGTSGDARFRGQVAYNHNVDSLSLVSTGYVRILSGSSRTEAVRIDSSNNLLVGKTATGSNTAGAEFTADGQMFATSSNVIAGYFNRQGATGTTNLIGFRVANSDAGTIQSSAGGTPAFAAASDQRLKDNITEHEPELANVMALRPVCWDWKDKDRGVGEGFVAQELEQTAWADLVSEGEDGYKMVSGLGAVETRLIKALQEAVTRIETLEAEVAALKGA